VGVGSDVGGGESEGVGSEILILNGKEQAMAARDKIKRKIGSVPLDGRG
jgi:hypothetical protein